MVLFQVNMTESPQPGLMQYHNGEEVVANQQRPAITKPDMKFSAVQVAMFGSHVEQNHAQNNQGFRDEFEVCCKTNILPNLEMRWWLHLPQSLYDGEDKSTAIATSADNRLKNRFASICVCECSRVAPVVCIAW